MTRTIGIDPGLTGAFALIEDNLLLEVEDMPTTATRRGGKQLNIPEVASILREWSGRGTTVKLEAVHAMPKQGVSSTFNFGMGYGALQGVIQTLGIPMALVTPQAWKKAAGLVGADKDYARTLALQLYPDADLARKKDIGRADAILIARYG
jgi:crossover junction endodeoxyribonuclease RuvC